MNKAALMKRVIVLFLLILLGCKPSTIENNNAPIKLKSIGDSINQENEIKGNIGGLRFSLKNSTTIEIKNISIGLPDTTLSFTTIKPYSKTPWIDVKSAYSYGYLKFNDSTGRDYTVQPKDYLGEILYKKGNMTFIITQIDTLKNYVSMDFSTE